VSKHAAIHLPPMSEIRSSSSSVSGHGIEFLGHEFRVGRDVGSPNDREDHPPMRHSQFTIARGVGELMSYTVRCSHCGRVVLTAPQLGEPEANTLLQHLCDEHPEVVRASASLDDLLKNFSLHSG
jgi:hypothetical protein